MKARFFLDGVLREMRIPSALPEIKVAAAPRYRVVDESSPVLACVFRRGECQRQPGLVDYYFDRTEPL